MKCGEMMCDEKRKNKRFLPLEEDTIVREIENELGVGGGGGECKDEMRQHCTIEKKALNIY